MSLDHSRNGGLRGVLLAAWLLLCLPFLATAGEIRIGGTGNALGTMQLLAEAFAKSHPETTIVVLPSIGTAGVVKAVAKGSVAIGLAAHPLSDEDARNGLTATEYARSPTVFAVQEKNKVTAISQGQVAEIYGGKWSGWPDGTTIRPVMRQPGDDNYRQVRMLSPEIEEALAVAEQRPGLPFAVTDQDAADKMETIPGSFGTSTLALIRSEKRALRALTLDGVAPTVENARSGRYPLVKQFYLVLPKNPAPEAQEFVKFVRSPQGIRILEQNGHFIP